VVVEAASVISSMYLMYNKASYGVDKPESVFLALCQGDGVVSSSTSSEAHHCTVDQTVVGGWRATLCCYQSFLKCGSKIPVSDWHCTKVNVVVRSRRAVDDDGAQDAIAVLCRKV
jgi:hypothetical protein